MDSTHRLIQFLLIHPLLRLSPKSQAWQRSSETSPLPQHNNSELIILPRLCPSFAQPSQVPELHRIAAMALSPNEGGNDSNTTWTPTNSEELFPDSSSPSSPQDNSWSIGGRNHPSFCFFKGVADGLAGGLMGSVFGFGSGLFKKQGFQGALREGGSSAKTFTILSGVHSIVSCYLKKVRGREDAWNAGIAGCATGLALSTPGTPQALAQSCLSFGAFSFILEYLNQTRPAFAATTSCESSSQQLQTHVHNHLLLHLNFPVLPPFTLPPLSFSGPLSFLNQELGGRARPF